MKRGQRLTLFLMGPAIMGSVFVTLRAIIAPPFDVGHALSLLPATVIGALFLSIIPAAIYAVVMELWLAQMEKRFRHSWSPSRLRSVTVLLSTLLGAAAGGIITWANGHPLTGIGALTGLALGLFLISEIFPRLARRQV